jgi:predicted nucleic acid-binding protein
MSGRSFFDTNIFIYSLDRSAPQKAAIAGRLIREALASHNAVISYQVVQEFFNVALRRFDPPMTAPEAEQYLATVLRPLLAVHSSAALFSEALRVHGRGGLSWHDALMVTAAQQSGCRQLLSEDLQHGRRFDSVQIVNPFL